MGVFDVLFGKKELKKANLDKLFAVATAQVTLDSALGLEPGGSAAVVIKPMSAGTFEQAAAEMRELVLLAARDSGSEVERTTDEYGYEWVVFRDRDFEDLVTLVHTVSSEIHAKGFGEQLLAAAFRFQGEGNPVYLIYGFKRGTFWPFVPTGEKQDRDNAYELRIKNQLASELPFEQDLTRWMGLYGAPM